MNFQVTAQITFVVKGLPALGTIRGEFFCASMDRHVIFEVPKLRELLETDRTLIFRLQMTLFVNLLKYFCWFYHWNIAFAWKLSLRQPTSSSSQLSKDFEHTEHLKVVFGDNITKSTAWCSLELRLSLGASLSLDDLSSDDKLSNFGRSLKSSEFDVLSDADDER
jgi:hypothetical protein